MAMSCVIRKGVLWAYCNSKNLAANKTAQSDKNLYIINALKFQTLCYILLFGLTFAFLKMQLFLKILCGIANSVDPDQIALEGAV